VNAYSPRGQDKLGRFSNTHLVTTIFLIGVLSTFVGVQFKHSGDSTPANSSLNSIETLSPRSRLVKNPSSEAKEIIDPEPNSQSTIEIVPTSERRWSFTIQIQPGENLESIFVRNNIPRKELQNIIDSGPLGTRLNKVFPGHELTFLKNEEGELLKLIYSPGPLETLEFEREGNGYISQSFIDEPEEVLAYKYGAIEHSLFLASQGLGLDDEITMRLAQIFQWDIDFVLDIRSGDEFYILYKELYLGDEMIGFGDIMAAEFINRGEHYRAVRYEDPSGIVGFYTPEGQSMKKAFLRAPVDFSRISSNFNLKRLHPIHRKNMPHRGIDYAAPRGTKVVASGDGRVTTRGRTKANGNYLIIKHGETIETKYLHLNGFAKGIRRGTKVLQGQTIGYVGSTGWATGPHLHYEFLVNGVHQNPRTISLPNAKPITKAQMDLFRASVEPTLEMLAEKKHKNTYERHTETSG
jgi:murein DD-endopeptidase MepM/ murein hydrolase activator NlpD